MPSNLAQHDSKNEYEYKYDNKCIDPCIGVDDTHSQCPAESEDVFHYTEGRYYSKQFLREYAVNNLIRHFPEGHYIYDGIYELRPFTLGYKFQ